MNARFHRGWMTLWIAWVVGLFGALPLALSAAEPPFEADIIAVKEVVEIRRAGATTWDRAVTNRLFIGDRVRTGERSRATLKMYDGSIMHLDEFSEVEMGRKPERVVVRMLRGVLSFFHRDEPGRIEVIGNGVSTLIRGTEFTFAIRPDGGVDLVLVDGEVGFTNEISGLTLQSGDVATARPGQAPRRTAVLSAGDAASVQWLLYYPAVLAPPELPLTAEVRAELAEALGRYESGDLLGALARYPTGRQPVSREERVLLAALVLAVGNVGEAERWLDGIDGEDPTARIAVALRRLIAAAQLRPGVALQAPELATEWLASSYARQAARDLPGALAAARQAVALRPDFGFGWVRVAELEFSFGRVKSARLALDRALQIAPRHAQAVALRGFLLAADYRTGAAESAFTEALALDPGLGNAWMGRGLARIRQGRLDEGWIRWIRRRGSTPRCSISRAVR